MSKEKIITAAVGIVALAAISYGSYLAYKPAGFLVPGLLLWLDVSLRKGG